MIFNDSHGNDIVLPEGAPVGWRISACAIVKDSAGRFLMVQSSNGLWQFPGGGVEQDETVHQALVREVQEETGYTVVAKSQPFHMNEQQFYHRRNEAFYHSLQLFFYAELTRKAPDTSLIAKGDKDKERSWLKLHAVHLETVHPTVYELTRRLIGL